MVYTPLLHIHVIRAEGSQQLITCCVRMHPYSLPTRLCKRATLLTMTCYPRPCRCGQLAPIHQGTRTTLPQLPQPMRLPRAHRRNPPHPTDGLKAPAWRNTAPALLHGSNTRQRRNSKLSSRPSYRPMQRTMTYAQRRLKRSYWLRPLALGYSLRRSNARPSTQTGGRNTSRPGLQARVGRRAPDTAQLFGIMAKRTHTQCTRWSATARPVKTGVLRCSFSCLKC